MSDLTARTSACCALLLAIGVLAGCASRAPRTASEEAPKEAVVTIAPGPHGHRFDMQQNGRSMTAGEFDAWMKARGIRVAKGAPAQAKPVTTSARGTATRRAR